MDTELLQKKKSRWTKEQTWNWYKHTKPCNNILNTHTCSAENCNYAHNLEEYMVAIKRHKFKIDDVIVNQLKTLEFSEPQPTKRMRLN